MDWMTDGLAEPGRPRRSQGLARSPRLGGDFSSLMLCCLLILLAYILSLPSLRQRPNRGKELELFLVASRPLQRSEWFGSVRARACVFVCVCVNC